MGPIRAQAPPPLAASLQLAGNYPAAGRHRHEHAGRSRHLRARQLDLRHGQPDVERARRLGGLPPLGQIQHHAHAVDAAVQDGPHGRLVHRAHVHAR